jgi:hypothetical protein
MILPRLGLNEKAYDLAVLCEQALCNAGGKAGLCAAIVKIKDHSNDQKHYSHSSWRCT